uniref:Putative RISC-loading complex subunit BRAFLDRAFT_242885 n=1 Tax=Lygus hesperus TaxID=30085 RepID=A0A0A9Z792_LYGHE
MQGMPMAEDVVGGAGIGLIGAGGAPGSAMPPGPTAGSFRGVHRRGRGGQHRLPPPDSLPLEEAAKLELQSMPSKTPVSVLQELLSRRGSTPKYELVQVEGAIHEPTFRYRVTVGEVLAMGTGRSKKEAKHAAAKAILDKLTGNVEGNGLSNSNNNLSEMVKSISSQEQSGTMVTNPIGVLQELCMSRRWPPPAYETEFEEGLPHERLFTISCIVFRHKETGTGKSKKIAKRLAAHNMWQRLKNLPVDNNSAGWNEGMDEDEMLTRNFTDGMKISSEWEELRHAKISTVTREHTQTISQFHKNLKSSEGPKLNDLKGTPLKDSDINFVQFLQEIASEQNFDVTYVDIEEKSISGMFQCLVQLSTLPVAVVHGSGPSSKDAQTSAALNALQYLKLMTKK